MLWWGRISIALTALALTLLVAEVGLRSLAQESKPAVLDDGRLRHRFNAYRADAALGYTLRPSWKSVQVSPEFQVSVHTNSLGLRGSAEPSSDPAVSRVLLLGDSFAFGYGVEDDETFASLLEARWRAEGLAVEVLNAGVPGYSLDHALVYLQTRGFDFDPDLILLVITANDAADFATSAIELDEGGFPLRTTSTRRMIDHRGSMQYVNNDAVGLPAWITSPPGWLKDHSALFNWASYRYARWWIASAEAAADTRDEPAPVGAIAEFSAAEITDWLVRSQNFRWRFHEHVRAEIEREAEVRGIALRTIYAGPSAGPMTEVCAAQGERCLDAMDLFEAQTDRSHFHADGHWNAAGHAAVAEALANWLP